jgi:hypothetical protein
MLFVKMKVALTDVVCGSPRRHEHHDLIVPLLAFFVGVDLVHLLWVVRYDTVRETGTMCIIVRSI